MADGHLEGRSTKPGDWAAYQPLPGYFDDDTPCWYVTLPLSIGITPQVMMARREDGVIAQAGGDSVSGRAMLPGEDPGGAPGDCADAARDGLAIVAAFRSTVDAIRQHPAVRANPQLADFAGDQEATICYLDGLIPASQPASASGSPPPPYDRAVLVVVGNQFVFLSAGHQESLPIQAP